MVNSITFTTFVINVAMEGLCEKYGDEVNLDRQNWIILKNKKYLGTLQRHHIQQVSIAYVYGNYFCQAGDIFSVLRRIYDLVNI